MFLMVNDDHDGKLNNFLPDNSDDKINGADDKKDMAELILRKIPGLLPDGGKIYVKKKNDSGDGNLKIFENDDTVLLDTSKNESIDESKAGELFTALKVGDISYFAEGLEPGELTLAMEYVNEKGISVGSDEIKITVAQIIVHPIASDFRASKDGRIIISTNNNLDKPQPEDRYYTNTKTTKNNTIAQTADRKITITAYVYPKDAFVGKELFFKVIDPDDLSPYEKKPDESLDTDGDDNKGGKGSLSKDKDTVELKTINGTEVAAVETELTFTDHSSGDNYQILVGFNRRCESAGWSIPFVAWKRIYLETDRMYKSGGTITQNFTPDANANDDILKLDNVDDFSVGQQITIFSPGAAVNTQVKGKDAAKKTITVPDMNQGFQRFSGVRPQNSNDTYEVSLDYIPMTYGGDTPGTDGGVFAEYVIGVNGSGNVPKYTQFSDNPTMQSFCLFWFQNINNRTNCVQIISAKKHSNGAMGQSNSSYNRCIIYTDAHTGSNSAAKFKDTFVHEIGHQFNVSGAHVDSNLPHRNHEDTDECLMTYASNDEDGVSEFCKDCIEEVRKENSL